MAYEILPIPYKKYQNRQNIKYINVVITPPPIPLSYSPTRVRGGFWR